MFSACGVLPCRQHHKTILLPLQVADLHRSIRLQAASSSILAHWAQQVRYITIQTVNRRYNTDISAQVSNRQALPRLEV
eukprot:4818431-Amphidinium_carterae.1